MGLPTRLDAFSARAATPSDTVSEPTLNSQMPDGFMVQVAGDVVLLSDLGSVITLPAVAANIVVPLRFQRINSTGTTATGIKALFQRGP